MSNAAKSFDILAASVLCNYFDGSIKKLFSNLFKFLDISKQNLCILYNSVIIKNITNIVTCLLRLFATVSSLRRN